MPSIHIEIKPIKLETKGTLAVGTGFRQGSNPSHGSTR